MLLYAFNYIDKVKYYIAKQKWNKLYDAYAILISKPNLINYVENFSIYILMNIQNMKNITDEDLRQISIIMHNYLKYFIYSDSMNKTLPCIMEFIQKNYKNINLNDMSNFISTVWNALYIKYQENKLYIPELTELRKYQQHRNILLFADLLKQYQIIGTINKVYDMYNNDSRDINVIKFNLIILLILKQYRAAMNFINNFKNDTKIYEELLNIYDDAIQNSKNKLRK